MSTIPITPGQIPKGGTIQLDPTSGRYQFFDPGYGQQGQFRQASLAELQAEKAGKIHEEKLKNDPKYMKEMNEEQKKK